MFQTADCNFGEVYKRLQGLFGLNQKAIGKALGCSQQFVARVLRQRKVPSTWLLSCFMTYKLNPLWILYGEPHLQYICETEVKPT